MTNQIFKLFPTDVEDAVLNFLKQKGYAPILPVDVITIKNALNCGDGYSIGVEPISGQKPTEKWDSSDLLDKVKSSFIGLGMYINNVNKSQTDEMVELALITIPAEYREVIKRSVKDLKKSSEEIHTFAGVLIDLFTDASNKGILKPKIEMHVEDLYEIKTYTIFSVSTENCFRNAEIFTIEDLLEYIKDDERDLFRLRHFGQRSMNEVIGFLRLHKLRKNNE